MKTQITILLLTSLLTTAVHEQNISKLVLHLQNENRSVSISGDQCSGGAVFNQEPSSCVCATGLWAFYRSSCEPAYILLGATSGQCFHMDFPIHKASLISPTETSVHLSSATAFDQTVTTIGAKFVTSTNGPRTNYFVPAGFPILVTTGTKSWRLPHRNLCIKPISLDSNVTNYCLFKHSSYEEYRLIDEDCKDEDDIISPLICQPYVQEHNANLLSCIEVETRNNTHGRFKREKSNKETKKQMGKTFIGAVDGLRDNKTDGNRTDTEILDEDENKAILTGTVENAEMNSEIWNDMTYRAQVILGLRQPRQQTATRVVVKSPSLEILGILKEIQQKTCPEHYVSHEHYDVAIGSFDSVQKNHLQLEEEFLDTETKSRIKEALLECKNNLTLYPFLERVEQPTKGCNVSELIPHGTYEMFGQILQLTVRHEQSSRFNEPIVETVWKIFVHAHSACYHFFKNNYNDHHRFTAFMLSLFTNEINDMWFSVTEVTPGMYNGFLGNAVETMDSVAYCAMFSRLDSGYPWDLPRPKKDNARKKREVRDGDLDFECLEDYDARNLCPVLEENFPKNFLEKGVKLE